MPKQFTDQPFPVRGVDTAFAYGTQPPLTTPVGVNVVAFEPTTDRSRGGSRPGLNRYVLGQVPAGPQLIQAIGVVIIASADALLANVPVPDLDPVTGLPPIDDPSSVGPPSSWGTGIIDTDPVTGLPVTGTDEGSRNPGGPGSTNSTGGGTGVNPRKVRHGGSGVQPSKNTDVTNPATGSGAPRICFEGNVQIVIHKEAPDIYGWNNQKPVFTAKECRLYNPPTIPAPIPATFPEIQAKIAKFLTENVPTPFTYSIWQQFLTNPTGGPPCTMIGKPCT